MKVPMLKKNREISDPFEMEQVLKQGKIISVAMCHDEQPYVLPFNYGFLNGLIYIHSAKEGFKLEVLAKNPKVSFNVITDVQLLPADQPKDCSVAYSSVVGFGKVRIVDDPVEKLAALEAIMVQYGVSRSSISPASTSALTKRNRNPDDQGSQISSFRSSTFLIANNL